MFGCGNCWCLDQLTEFNVPEPLPQPFTLPSPLPKWPPGQGFACGRINLVELEVVKITTFQVVWNYGRSNRKSKGVTFYKPVGIPDGFYCLGHYCQINDQPLQGYVLAARQSSIQEPEFRFDHIASLDPPALRKPHKYTLIWSSESDHNGSCYFWLPKPPKGYKAMGFVVTDTPEEPSVDEVRCVRSDLTERSETCDLILTLDSKASKSPFQVWNTRPYNRGMNAKGVSVGTFYCRTYWTSDEVQTDIACVKNLDPSQNAMPNLDQIHALVKNYGPTVIFHPSEAYFPSSVQWFFKNGAVLYQDGFPKAEPVKYDGSNLPSGGENDGKYWIDLPVDEEARDFVKRGSLESAELYIHVKPALGGTFTDIAMWVFYPFNGAATLKVGAISIPMTKIGQHVSDWEHFTLRVSNFTGELWQIFFSQHSGGHWVNASDLEFIEGNRAVVYSSKHGHASYPHPGTYLQGSTKLGVGVRNDVAQSRFYLDSSIKYQLIAAEYLGEGFVSEPCWLQYMREWGPTIVYESRSELDKIIDLLPFFMRFSVENIVDLFPTELYGEEGPTGPEEKDNWMGDEIC